MRSMKVSILTTDRPATSDHGHISATGRPIHSMFGSRVGFSGTADQLALFAVRKIQDGGRRHFKWPYLRLID